MIALVPFRAVRPSVLRILLTAAAVSTLAAAQQHPAFSPPSGFTADEPGADGSRVFRRAQSNGDRLRIRVVVGADGAVLDGLAKAAAETSDKLRDDTRQELAAGTLQGVAYSCLGSSETVDGVPFTRYRRVMAFKPAQGAPFSVRADVLAKEPKPAQSTLETMARSLADWQTALGGGNEPPPDPQAPGSRPVLGGSSLISLKDGGDLEIRVPAAWGRADLELGEGRSALYFGPAREVLAALTTDSMSKDKDRLGPYLLIERIRRDAFKDLIDQQLLDIAESLMADYVAQQAEAGVTLKLGQRDEGTLGTRVVISVPFEESRKSGTQHKGRLVAMLHRGVLVIVTASHPVEGYDQGWDAFAAALDTLTFTGLPEPDPAAPATRPATDPAANPANPATGATDPGRTAAPASGTDAPAPVRVAAGPSRLAAADAAWSSDGPQAGLRTARIPLATPITFAYPADWPLTGTASKELGELAFVAAPDAASATAPRAPRVRVEYRAFREELASGDAGLRLMGLLKTKLAREGFPMTLESERRQLGGQPAIVVRYRGFDPPTVGAMVGVVADGTALVADLRLPAAGPADSSTDREALVRLDAMINAVALDPALQTERRNAGPFSIEVPDGWTFDSNANRAGGYDVFLRAPSGLDVRFQTARQPKPELVTYDVIRKVGSGFLVEGLRVLSSREFADGTRHDQPGARIGMRFRSTGESLTALVTACVIEDQLVFALRGAPTGYRGRDLAVAWRVMRSFGAGGGFGPRPPRIDGARFAERAVFTRTELDDLSPEGDARAPGSLYVAFLPDGTAGVVVTEAGGRRDLRGSYSIAGDLVTLDCQALGAPKAFRLADGGEMLKLDGGEVLFRDRREETP